MSSLLSNLAQEVNVYVDWTSTTVGGVFNLMTSTGAVLLQSFVFLATHLWMVALNLVRAASILLNDFILFVGDVYDLSDNLITFLIGTVYNVVDTVFLFLKFLFQVTSNSHLALSSFIQTVLELLWALLLSTKALLILVGDGTIFLFQLGPSFLVSVYIGIVTVTGWVFQKLWIFLFRVVSGTVTALSGLHNELTDIPASSLLGMLLALVIAVVARFYLKSINWTALCQKMKTILGDCLRRRPRLNMSGSARLNDSGSSVDEMSAAARTSPLKRSSLNAVNRCTRENLLRQLELEREDKLCVVCQDQKKCVILLPCRHYCLCQICMQRVVETDPVCPICRQYVLDHLRIYG